jgi:regulator of RNase E activity RraA
VRDTAKMTAMGFAVFARGTSPYDSRDRNRVIDVDVVVEIDGVRFSPGDLVIADVDGIVVVPQSVENEAIGAAWEKVNAENVVRDAIAGGMTASEAFKKYGVL